jgi:membrane-associated phospholipid phosphatase
MVAATSIVLLTPDQPAVFHAAIYGLGASIGLARIMADRHFLTDVLVGGAIGYGITRAVFADQKSQTSVVAGLTSLGYRIVF